MALPTWIANIFTGLGSIDITSYAGGTRLLQVILSVVLVALSGNLIGNSNSSLSSFTDDINSLLGNSDVASSLFNATGSTTNSSAVVLQSLKSTGILSAGTSIYTTLSHTTMSLMPYAFTRDSNSMTSSTELDSLSGVFGLSNGEFIYASGVSGSEVAAMTLWGASAIYSTAKYGNWDCSDPVKLLQQYNQSDVDSDSLSLFNEILSYDGDDLDTGDADNTTLSMLSDWEDIYSIFNSTINISGANLTSITAKQELMVKLSQDCMKKKASIAVCWLGVATFVFSGTLVTVSANRLSNGTTVNSVSTSSSSSSESATTRSLEYSSNPIELLSVSADTSDGIPMSRDHQRVMRNMKSFFASHIQVLNSVDSTGSRYICKFLLRNTSLDHAIETETTVRYLLHPPHISTTASTIDNLPTSISSISDPIEFKIDEIAGIYSNSLSSTSKEKIDDLDSLEKLVVFFTVNSINVRICFDVKLSKQKIVKIKDDPELQLPVTKYKMRYSRAILFPMPTTSS